MDKPQYLAEVEQLVLLALLRLEPEAYGAAIWREIEERGRREVLGTTVYAALDRLEAKEFVEFNWSGPAPVPGGRPKKMYRTTKKGKRALAQSLRAINEMQAGLKLGFATK